MLSQLRRPSRPWAVLALTGLALTGIPPAGAPSAAAQEVEVPATTASSAPAPTEPSAQVPTEPPAEKPTEPPAPVPAEAPAPPQELAPVTTPEPVLAAAAHGAPLDALADAGLSEPGVTSPATDGEAVATGAADDRLRLAGTAAEVPGVAMLTAPADQVVVALTAPLATDDHDVVVLGASWERASSTVRVDLRLRGEDGWGDWTALPVDDVGPEDEGRPGTEPFVVSGGEDVQVRLTTADGSVPVGARLAVFGDDVTERDAAVAQPLDAFGSSAPRTAVAAPAAPVAPGMALTAGPRLPGTDDTATPMPKIRLRAEWGAAQHLPDMDVGTVLGATIHHTAGTNSYSASEVPGILRGIQRYHMQSRGWSDIGYNFLVDKYGGVWEGRFGGIRETMKGVHASAFNGITTGISIMGNHDTTGVPAAARESVTALLAWKLALHGVPADGRVTYGGVSYPAVIAHKDVPGAATACPGRYGYAWLPELRAAAAARQVFARNVLDSDVTGDALADVVPTAGGTFAGRYVAVENAVQIGNGWSSMDLVVGSPSLKGGDGVDLVYRHGQTGLLSVYHGNGNGGFTGKTVWGYGWAAMSAVIAPGDWTGDGHADLLAVEKATGALWLYRGDGKGNLARRQQIGQGWRGIRSVMAAGDMNGDGTMDLVAIVDATSELRLYNGDGRGGWRSVQVLGDGFEEYDTAVGLGDMTGDGSGDVVLRNRVTGTMFTVAGDGRGGAVATRLWGKNWHRMGVLVAAPGWFGDERPVLITFNQSTGLLYAFARAQGPHFVESATGPSLVGAVRSAVVGDVTGTGAASVVSLTADGRLLLHEATGGGAFAAARTLAEGWGDVLDLAPAADMSRDGVPDLLVVRGSGALEVHPFAGDLSGVLEESFVIGKGFGPYRVTGVGGWTRDTRADVVAVHRTDGTVRWFEGLGRAGLRGGTVIAEGWKDVEVTAVGDVTASGGASLLVRDRSSGSHSVHTADGRGGLAPALPAVGIPDRPGDAT